MSSTRGFDLGVMFRRENPPEALPAYARRAEQLGLDELWVVEDCFYGSGIASAAVALADTNSIAIGLGIMPAVGRNAAFAAMEIATLARLYPGRLYPGMGHGVTDWMKQIGAFPVSQLAALGETADVVQRLLAGEGVTFHGSHVNLDNVKLEFPPSNVPPLSLGVRGPKSLFMSGRVAGGTILAEMSSQSYIRWAREQIQEGQAAAGRSGEKHRVTVFMLYAVDADSAAAKGRLRPTIASWLSYGQKDYIRALVIEDDVNALLASGGRDKLEAEMPDGWIEQMAVVGTPEECAYTIHQLVDAGADSVVLVTEQHEIERLAAVESVLGLLNG